MVAPVDKKEDANNKINFRPIFYTVNFVNNIWKINADANKYFSEK